MLCNFSAGEVGVASPRCLAAVNGNWPAEWNPLLAHARSGRVGDLYAATAGGGVLRHDGDQWTALAARQKWGVVVTAILLRPFGRRGLMITMRRALGVPATAAAASPQATALGAFTLLVHRHFRPRLDRLPLFSTQALTALDVPMLTIVGGRDAMVDSYQTKHDWNGPGSPCASYPRPATCSSTRPSRSWTSCAAATRCRTSS